MATRKRSLASVERGLVTALRVTGVREDRLADAIVELPRSFPPKQRRKLEQISHVVNSGNAVSQEGVERLAEKSGELEAWLMSGSWREHVGWRARLPTFHAASLMTLVLLYVVAAVSVHTAYGLLIGWVTDQGVSVADWASMFFLAVSVLSVSAVCAMVGSNMWVALEEGFVGHHVAYIAIGLLLAFLSASLMSPALSVEVRMQDPILLGGLGVSVVWWAWLLIRQR